MGLESDQDISEFGIFTYLEDRKLNFLIVLTNFSFSFFVATFNILEIN